MSLQAANPQQIAKGMRVRWIGLLGAKTQVGGTDLDELSGRGPHDVRPQDLVGLRIGDEFDQAL